MVLGTFFPLCYDQSCLRRLVCAGLFQIHIMLSKVEVSFLEGRIRLGTSKRGLQSIINSTVYISCIAVQSPLAHLTTSIRIKDT